MAKLDDQARRLHPKLRMFDNGSMAVNSTRSDISILVACSEKEPADDEGQKLLEFDMAGAQQEMLNLSLDVPGLLKGRLPKRKKLEEQRLADKAYVNVTIEVARGASQQEGTQAVNKIVESCREQLREGR